MTLTKAGKPRKKMGAPRQNPDRVVSNLEAVRKFADKAASIDEELNEALLKINWERRNQAEGDIVLWVNTYCVGVLLDEAPPPKGEEILREMCCAITDSRPYMVLQSRGSGKTSYVECVIMYALSTGKRKFPVIIGQNATSAQNILNDLFRMIGDEGTAFSEDYPFVTLPFAIAHGSFRRRQTYNSIPTEISKTSSKVVLARLKNKDGTDFPTSGSVIATRGILSGLRGLKYHSLRPDVAVLDDVQDDESASSPEQVEKLLTTIQKAVFNLGGKGKIAILQTATPICPDDLVERVVTDKAWKTTKFPAIIQWPKDILENPDEGLWHTYFQLYDEENAVDSSHQNSLAFYAANRASMDEGAEVLNPYRYKEEDGHLSALQALLEKKHTIGDAAFLSEYQMEPKRIECCLQLTPKQVVSRMNPVIQENVIPDGFTFCCASIDLNPSYAASLLIMCFRPDGTSAIIRHSVYRMKVDQQLTAVQYNQRIYDTLAKILKELKKGKVKIDALGIDAGGRNWSAVCEFAKNAFRQYGIPCCAMSGRAATMFNPLARNRLRNAVGRTVLCCDDKEAIKQGAGNKWLFFDSDHFKETGQRAFLAEVGSPGGCSLYNSLAVEHIDFATQVCNEKLKWKKVKADGRDEYHWVTKDPHDFVDCLAMCRAIAENQGLSRTLVTPVPGRRLAKRRRVRVV